MLRTSAPVAGGLYRVDTLPTSELTQSDVAALRALHAACFPADAVPAATPDADWLDRVAVCHDADACVWMLLWETQAARDRARWWRRKADTRAPSAPCASDTLVGMCAGTPYTAAMYGFALGVHPRRRGRGLGPRIMHALQAAALAAGVGAIAATVDAAAPRLVAYYVGHGGVVQETGVTAPGAPPPPSVRVVKKFDAAELARVTVAADASIIAAIDRTAAARRRAAVALAAAVAAACAVAVARRRGVM